MLHSLLLIPNPNRLKSLIIPSDSIDKVQWNALVEKSPQGQIYQLFEYINCLCNNSWEAVLIEENGTYVGALPFFRKRKYGIQYFIHPPYCQFWGIFMDIPLGNNTKYYSKAKKVITKILETLPSDVKLWHLTFSHRFDYLLPFIWHKWSVKTRFSYHLKLDRSAETLLAAFGSHTRRDIKKAQSEGIVIKKEFSADTAINIFRTEKPHLISSSDLEYLENLQKLPDQLGKSLCFTYVAYKGNSAIASLLYFRFKNVLTYLFGTVKSEYRNSGAISAIIWTSIKENLDAELMDFDGSMIEEIETFFRGFDTYPVPFHECRKSLIPFKS